MSEANDMGAQIKGADWNELHYLRGGALKSPSPASILSELRPEPGRYEVSSSVLVSFIH